MKKILTRTFSFVNDYPNKKSRTNLTFGIKTVYSLTNELVPDDDLTLGKGLGDVDNSLVGTAAEL